MVPAAGFVRLFRFSSAEPGVVADQLLRDSVLPGLGSQPGLVHVYAGRAGAGDSGERVTVAIFAPAESGLPNGHQALARPFDFERMPVLDEPSLEVLPLAISLLFETPAAAHILRVFRGRVRDGELADYVDDARSGTLADVAAGRGPAALFLGVEPADRFVTVSLWTAWERIEAATGGNIRHPVATRHAHRLLEGTAAHYELVPGAG